MTGRVIVPVPDDESTGPRWSVLVKAAGAVLSVLVVVFLIMRTTVISPRKPQFTLRDVTLHSFNISNDPILLNTSLEVTVTSRNPNSYFGLYYESVDAYATYQGQQVTLRTTTPETYLGHRSTDVWTMFISGTSVPVAPYIGVALGRDWYNGLVMIVIKLDGKVKWKLGAIAKGNYHMTVRCPAYLTFGAKGTGISAGDNNAIKYLLWQRCNVNFSR